MKTNPWLHIPAKDYDGHMSHENVRQRGFLDAIFADVLNQQRPTHIAILGSATGGGLDQIHPNHPGRVTAIDINPDYLKEVEKRFHDQIPNLELVEADLHACEMDHDSFDFIYAALILEYVDPDLVLRRVAQWLVPGGLLVIVLQLPSADVKTVTDTGIQSLKSLESLMKHHRPEAIKEIAARWKLQETCKDFRQIESGKQFFIGSYRRDSK